MNGTVGCHWALRTLGVERRGGEGGHSWMLVDVGRPSPPPKEGVSKHKACFETVSKHASPRINFQQLRNRQQYIMALVIL